jgi:hypothetical protein
VPKTKQPFLDLLRDFVGFDRTIANLTAEWRAMKAGRVAFFLVALLAFLGGLKTCDLMRRQNVPTPTAASQVIKLAANQSETVRIDASKGPPVVYVFASAERHYEYTVAFSTQRVPNGTSAEVYIEIPKSNISGGPVIKIRDEGNSGNLLTEIYGDTDNPVYATFRYHFDGVSWHWFP